MPRNFRSPERKKKQRRRVFLRSILLLLLFGVIAGFFSWLSFKPELSIRNIAVDGESIVMPEELKESVREELAGTHFFLFSRASAFLYPEKRIEEKLARLFPRLASASVSLVNTDTLEIKVKDREPAYILCDASVKADKEAEETPPPKTCYFLDKEGFVFAEAPHFSGNAYLEFYDDWSFASGISPLGRPFLPEESFLPLRDALRDLAFDTAKPAIIFWKENDAVEVQFDGGWKIIFHKSDNYAAVLENFRAIKETEEWKKIIDGKAEKKLHYLDLRFGNKVYYKFSE